MEKQTKLLTAEQALIEEEEYRKRKAEQKRQLLEDNPEMGDEGAYFKGRTNFCDFDELKQQLGDIHSKLNSIDRDPALQNITRQLNEIKNNPTSISGCPGVEPFFGLSTENPKLWLTRFENFCELNKLKPETRKCAFHLYMKGPAEIWASELPDDRKATYEILKNEFLQYFDTQTSRWSDEHGLSEKKQHGSEPIELYIADMRSRFSRLNKSPDDKLAYFVRGLRNGIKRFVISRNPSTLEDAEQLSRLGSTLETILPSEIPNHDSVSSIVTNGNELNLKIEKQQEILNDIQQQLKQGNPTRQYSGSPFCHRCNKYGHTFQSCDRQQQVTNGPQCFKCRKFGHIQRFCKSRTDFRWSQPRIFQRQPQRNQYLN